MALRLHGLLLSLHLPRGTRGQRGGKELSLLGGGQCLCHVFLPELKEPWATSSKVKVGGEIMVGTGAWVSGDAGHTVIQNSELLLLPFIIIFFLPGDQAMSSLPRFFGEDSK